MIVQMKLSKEEAKKLWHITLAASQYLDRDPPVDVATLCLNIVRAYLDKHYVVIDESKDRGQED